MKRPDPPPSATNEGSESHLAPSPAAPSSPPAGADVRRRAISLPLVALVLLGALWATRGQCEAPDHDARQDAIWMALADSPPRVDAARDLARSALRRHPSDTWLVFVYQVSDALVAGAFPESFRAVSREAENEALEALLAGDTEGAHQRLVRRDGPTGERLRFWLRLLASVDAARHRER